MIRGFIYRGMMRLAHRYNWHYAPPIYLEGDVQLWCKWCGFRQTRVVVEVVKPGFQVNISDENNDWNKRALKVSEDLREAARRGFR